MASKRRFRQRVCERKQAYRTMGYAIMVSKKMQAKHGEAFSAYECKFCGQHHVGHMTQSTRSQLKHQLKYA